MTRCKVCNSPNRSTYEDMHYNFNYNPNALANLSKSKGDSIGRSTFIKHFKENHTTVEEVEMIVTGSGRPIEAKPSSIKKSILTTLEMIKRLQEHIKISSQMIQKMFMMGGDSKNVKNMVALMTEVRHSLDVLPKLISSLEIHGAVEPEDLVNAIGRIWQRLDLTPNQLAKLEQSIEDFKQEYGDE